MMTRSEAQNFVNRVLNAGDFYTGIAQIGVCQLDAQYWYEDTNPQRTFGVRVMDDEGVHEMYEGAEVREYLRDMR